MNLNPSVRKMSRGMSPRLAPLGDWTDISLGGASYNPATGAYTDTSTGQSQIIPASSINSDGTVGASGGWPTFNNFVGSVSSYIWGPVGGLVSGIGSLFENAPTPANPTVTPPSSQSAYYQDGYAQGSQFAGALSTLPSDPSQIDTTGWIPASQQPAPPASCTATQFSIVGHCVPILAPALGAAVLLLLLVHPHHGRRR